LLPLLPLPAAATPVAFSSPAGVGGPAASAALPLLVLLVLASGSLEGTCREALLLLLKIRKDTMLKWPDGHSCTAVQGLDSFGRTSRD
jgi:hypothetical protein